MVVKNGRHRLVGFVDLGEGHDIMASLTGMYYLSFTTILCTFKEYNYKCHLDT